MLQALLSDTYDLLVSDVPPSSPSLGPQRLDIGFCNRASQLAGNWTSEGIMMLTPYAQQASADPNYVWVRHETQKDPQNYLNL